MRAPASSPHTPPVRAGMLTLLLTVAMLCLAVLAVLALVTAQADLRLADRAAQGLSQTAQADNKGQRFLQQLDQTLAAGGSPEQLGAAQTETGEWEVQLDCGQAGSLHIRFIVEQEKAQPTLWQLQRPWQPEQSLDLWAGPDTE